MYKQVIIVRADLGLPKGKLAAQAAHASVEATLRCDSRIVQGWRNQGMMKVVCKVADEKELYSKIQQAKDNDIVTSVITDAGKTVVAPGTVTCGAIGPALEEDVDKVTSDLSLM